MSAHTEWELLKIAEDIAPGDMIAVETEDGATEEMKYIKTHKRRVILRDGRNSLRYYLVDTMEEVCGVGEKDCEATFITGKIE